MRQEDLNVTIQSLAGKNKKLYHEYSNFTQRVGYFLLSSVYKGKAHPKEVTSGLYMKCPDNEALLNKDKLEKARQQPVHSSVATANLWNDHFSDLYTFIRQIHVGIETEKPKRNVLRRLKEMFDNNDLDSSILVFCGSTSAKGAIIVETKEYGTEEINLKDVLAEWNKKTSQQKHLLIILDSNFSGSWVSEFNNMQTKPDSVSILASCRENQKITYFELGNYFSYNLMKLLKKSQSETVIALNQVPQFAGSYLDCKKYTNLYLNFNSWASLIAVQKSEFTMVEYDNGIYTGHMEGGQKHFWGTFSWKTGTFKNCQYKGEFQKGKLHGKGIMNYANGRIYEGDFKLNAPEGVATETYANGDKYVGRFLRGFKTGLGTYFFANGQVYEGNFSHNKPNGRGKLKINATANYVGSFKNGKCNGEGCYKYENGDVYEGTWVESMKHGKGIYRYSNGDVYEGDFLNGSRHGQGKLTMISGEVYEGGWEDDKMSGEGRYLSNEEQVYGEWNKGNLVKKPFFFKKTGSRKVETTI